MRRYAFSLGVLIALAALFLWQSRREEQDNGSVATRSPEVRAVGPTPAPNPFETAIGPTAQREPAAVERRVLASSLPVPLRDRASFRYSKTRVSDGRHVYTVNLDGALLVGGIVVAEADGRTVHQASLPGLPAHVPPYPTTDESRMTAIVERELGKLESESILLLRKMWMPERHARGLRPAVEFLVRARHPDTHQQTEEIFQFDATSGTLVKRYAPVKH